MIQFAVIEDSKLVWLLPDAVVTHEETIRWLFVEKHRHCDPKKLHIIEVDEKDDYWLIAFDALLGLDVAMSDASFTNIVEDLVLVAFEAGRRLEKNRQ